MSTNSTAGDFIDLYGEFETPDFWSDYGVVDEGFVAPDFQEIIQRQVDLFRDNDVFGSDLDIDPSTPEGQYIYNEAKDKYSLILMAQAVYNSFSMFNSTGLALDRNMAYIGITRRDDSYSSVTVKFTTTDGITPVTLKTGYQIANTNGDVFTITNTITFTNTATVTAIADEPGEIDVSAGAVSVITNTRGNLASVTNEADGTTGSSAESDTELRQRGIISSQTRSRSRTDSTLAQIKNIDGVLQARVRENKSSTTVGYLTPHSVRYLVRGGSDSEIGEVLYANEVPGISYKTNGTDTVTYTHTEDSGVETEVVFDRPEETTVYIQITLSTRNYDDEIKAAVLSYAENTSYGFNIGENVRANKFYGAVYGVLQDNGVENDNVVSSIYVSTDNSTWEDTVDIDDDAIGVFETDNITIATGSD